MTVEIYSWPDSQICQDCEYCEFFLSKHFDNSDYLCEIACKDNDGLSCPLKKEVSDVFPED